MIRILTILLLCLASVQAAVVYVAPTPAGLGNGSSWANAAALPTALSTVLAGDEIWVKAGTYKPTAGGDRAMSFLVPASVTLYGGFAGNETLLSQRSIKVNVGILSGDIGTIGSNADNSYHVVTGGSGCVIDGLTIRDGNASGSGTQTYGGGIYYAGSGAITIKNCNIASNAASGYGAGAFVYPGSANPTFQDCVFQNNTATSGGGGLFTQCLGQLTLTRCLFQGNSAIDGAGVLNYSCTPVAVDRCIFAGNTASGNGGGYSSYATGSVAFTSSVFSGNNAGSKGGAVFASSSTTATLANCTVTGNSSGAGSGAVHFDGSGTGGVTNGVLWNNTNGQLYNVSATLLTLANCLVQGGLPARFTSSGVFLTSDPLFVGATDPDGADNVWGTADDGLRPQGNGPGVNQGTAVGAPATDLAGAARPLGSGYDIGAYECRGVIYVNSAGTGTGTSWATGYITLTTALAAAGPGDEIWVKAGTYKPGAARASTFTIPAGASVYGGFNGSEGARVARNWRTNLTILSGEVLTAGISDNCYHVVTPGNAATLDGFIVRDGYAIGGSPSWGGGILCNGTAPLIRNCVITANYADWGGGIVASAVGANPTLENCVLSANLSLYGGGGMFIYNSAAAILRNCTIAANTGDASGGGVTVHTSSVATITNTISYGNNGTTVGVNLITSSSALINNSLIQGSFTGASWNGVVGTNNGGNIGGNNDTDPLFVAPSDADGADNIWLTLDDGLRLRSASPAANNGVAITSADILGQGRPLGGGSDIGAYEGRCPVGAFQLATSTVSETAGTANIAVTLSGAADYSFNVPWSVGDGGSPDVTVGVQNGTFEFPLYTYYEDARTESIYLQSELGAAKTLRNLTLQVTGLPGQSMSLFTVRLKHTALSTFTSSADWEDHRTDWTTVYQGTVTVAATGALTLGFQTPFAYNGTSNLLVDISFNNQSYTNLGWVQSFTPSGNRSLHGHADSWQGDPLTWSPSYLPGTAQLDNRVPVATFGTAVARGTLTIIAGSTSGSIAVPIIDDAVDEDDQSVAVVLGTPTSSVPGRAIAGSPTTHTLTITDDDATPTVQFVSASSYQGEWVADRSLEVTLSGQTTRTVTVNFTTPGGGSATQAVGAAPGVDVVGVATGTVTFTPTQTSALVARTVTADGFQEADETFSVALSAPVFASLGSTTQHAATIANDDSAYVYVSPVSTTVTESSALPTATVNISLNAAPAPGATVTLTFATTDAGEITVDDTDAGTGGVQNTIAFTDANWNSGATVTLRGQNDDLDDGDQFPSIAVTLAITAGTDSFYGALNPDDVLMTVRDDDVAGITVGYPLIEASAVSVNAATGVVTFAGGTDLSAIDSSMRLVFAGGYPNAGEFSVVSVNDGIDTVTIDLNDGSLTDTALAQVVTILQPISGPVLEAPLNLTASGVGVPAGLGTWQVAITGDISLVQAGMSLVLAGQSTRTFLVAGIAGQTITLRNLTNTGLPAGEITAPTGTAGSQGVTIGGVGLVKARLRAQPSVNVGLGFASADTTEGAPSSSSLTFTTANWSTYQTVQLLPINDAVEDGDQTYDLQVGPATGDASFAGLDPKDIPCATMDDDARGITISTSSVAVTENGATATYTVVLTSEPTATVTVTPGIGGAIDFAVAPSTLTFTTANWATPQTITVSAVDDALVEALENFAGAITHTASGGGYGAISGSPDVDVAVTSNDTAGFIILPTTTAASPLSVPEGGQAVFSVRLSAEPTAALDVSVSLSGVVDDGDADGAVEATISSATLSFDDVNWATPQLVSVSTTDDSDSVFETYTVVLTANGIAEYLLIDPDDVLCRNADDDIPGISITQIIPSGPDTVDGATAVTEGSTGDRYQVRLNTSPAGGGFVFLGIGAASSELAATPTFLLFTSATWNVPQTVTLAASDDAEDEISEIHLLDHTVINTSEADYLVSDATATATVAGGLVTAVNVATGGSGYDATHVPVVSFVGGGGSGAAATATVAVGAVTGYTVNNAGSGYTSAPTVLVRWLPTLGATVVDNDTAGIVVTPTSGLIVTEGGGAASFYVSLGSQPTANVTIGLSQAGDTDEATLSAASLLFTPANWSTAQQVTVTGVTTENLDDGNRSFTVVTQAAASADANYSGRNAADVSCTSIDDDSVGVILSKNAVAVTEGSVTTDTYTVRLAAQPSASVTVTVNPGQQVTATPSTLTFTTGNWLTPQAVAILAVEDDIDEAAVHSSTITHAAVGGDYTGVAVGSVTASVSDEADDAAGFTLSAAAITVASEAGGTQTFTVQPTSKPTGTITVSLATSDSAVASVSPASVTFTPDSGSWDAVQTITVTAVDDQRDTADRTASIITTVSSTDPTYNGRALADVTVTITDDDIAGVAVTAPGGGVTVTEVGSTATFTVRLDSQPASGATITIPLVSSDTDQASVSPASLSFTSATWSTPQTVTITGRDQDLTDNGVGGVSLKANLQAVSVSAGTDAAYAALVTPSAGTADAQDVTITVARSNALPTLDPISDQDMAEDDAALTVTLTGISSGQTGELQNVFIRATSSNPGLIADPQASDFQLLTADDATTSRDLVLTPVANASGTAVITVTVSDDATVGSDPVGTVQRSFLVTVTASDDAPVVAIAGVGVAFVEDGSAVQLDAGLTVSDVDSPNLVGATVTLDVVPDGASELLSVSALGLVSSWDAGTGQLTLSGNLPPAAYQAALRSVTYHNGSQNPTVGSRVASILVDDGTGTSAPVTVSIAVSGGNDAPVIADTAACDPISEDVAAGANPGTVVASLIAQFLINDEDAADAQGLAIVAADETHGSWQYSPDPGVIPWIELDPSAGAALLLSGDATQTLRFLPAADFVGSASLTVRAWDQTAGVDGDLNADVSTTGGSTPFSATTATITIAVGAVNDPPTISGAAVMNAVFEDVLDSANDGTTAAALVAALVITDTDAGDPKGLAVVAADETHGVWEVSFDGGNPGGTWVGLGAASTAAAILLPNDATVFVRFRPVADYTGTAALTVRAWDQSEGVAGGTVDAGVSTSCSTTSALATITVSPVNDAPYTLTAPTGGPLIGIAEDVAAGANTGTPVAALIDGRMADVDALAAQGIAITAATGAGTWQYSINSGTGWNAIGAVTATSARLLTDNGTVLLRYLPALHENGTVDITYHVWDRTSGSNGTLADPSTNGGITAFSTATMVSSLTVSAVNDAPTIAVALAGGSGLGTEETAMPIALAAASTSLDDVDAAGLTLTVTAPGGAFAGVSTGTGVVIDTSVPDVISASGSPADLAAWLDALTCTWTPPANLVGSQDVVFAVSDNGLLGAGGTLTASADLAVSITAVNDAPTIGGALTLPTIAEDVADGDNTGATVDALVAQGSVTIADVDNAQRGLAIVGPVAAGWQYQTAIQTSWTAIPVVAAGSVFPLSADGAGADKLRFQPALNATGSPASTVTIHAWDGTVGGTATVATIAALGSSLSAATITASIIVTPVNDAPVLAAGVLAPDSAYGLSGQWDNAASATISTGISDLLGGAISDIDAGAQPGIVITGLTATAGTWQYTVNNGTAWTPLASASDAAALLLYADANHRLRFVPDAATTGTATLTIRAWDRTSGTDAAVADASITGGTTAFSSAAYPVRLSYGVLVAATGGTTAVTEGGSGDTYEVSLATAPSGDVTVTLAVPGGLQAAPATLTFTTGNWSTPQLVSVTAVDDAVDQGTRTPTVTHSASGGGFTGIGIAGMAVQVSDDDAAGVTVTPTSGLIVTESGSQATFSVVLTSQPSTPVTVSLANLDPTEVSLSATSLLFTTADWSTPQIVTLTGVDDAIDDGDIATTIALTVGAGDAGYLAIDPSDVAVTTTDNDTRGLALSPAAIETDESGATATVAVVLATQPSATVTVTLALGGDTDEAGLSASVLSFTTTNWSTTQLVTVTGADDGSVLDGDRAYTVTASASGGDYAGLSATALNATNRDNDAPAVLLSQTGGSTAIAEGGTTDTVNVVLAVAPAADVTVTLAGDADVGLSATTLTFTAVTWSTPQTVTLTAVNDQIAEGAHTGTMSVASVAGDVSYAGLSASPVVATITDNDTAAIAVTPSSGLTVTETGGSATFQVAIATQPTADVSFAVSSSNLAEGTVSPATLVFTAVNWQSAQTVTVTGVDDASDDGSQVFTAVVAPAVSADAGYVSQDPSDVTVVCTDNDTAGVVVSPTSGLINDETGGSASFTVQLTSLPTAAVQIDLVSSDLSQATVPANVTIAPGAWQTPVVVTVAGVDDAFQDPNHGWTIQVGVTSADALYQAIDPADVDGTNSDDDSPGLLLTTPSLLVTEAAGVGHSLTYQARLATAPNAGEIVTVAIAPAGLGVGQATLSPSALVFTDADWSTSQTVTATAVDDAVAEGAHTVPIGHAVSTSGGLYSGLTVPNLSLAVADDDTAGVSVTPTSGLTTSEVGGSDTFDVVLTSQPTVDVVINLASSDLGQGAVSPVQLTFTPASWSTPQTVTVTGADGNGQEDGNVLYGVGVTVRSTGTVDPRYVAIDPTDVTLTNLSVANPPTLSLAAALTIAEDAAEQSVALTGISNGQPLSEIGVVTVNAVLTAESTSGLITGLAVDYTDPLTTGSLRFTPGANLSGTATITVTVDDGEGQSLDRTLAVTITAVNDQPFVTLNAGSGSGLDLAIGDLVPITGARLMADDLESPTPANTLTFTIILPPSQGQLLLNGAALSATAGNNTCTTADISGGLVAYQHTGVTAGTDGFAFTVTDPGLAVSPVQIFTFDIAGLSPPQIDNLAGDASAFAENAATATALDSGLILDVVDVDSPMFTDGFISIDYVGASSRFDQLSLATGGSLGISGSTLTWGGLIMGDIVDDGSPGAGATTGERLLINNLTDQATPARVAAVLQALRFSAIGENPLAGTRTIDLTINDGDQSTVVQVTVVVAASDDAPVVPTQTIVLTPGLSISGQIQASDPEGAALTFAAHPGATVPNRGAVTINADGSFLYTHTNLTGFTDSLLVDVSDGGLTTTATIPIVISDVDPLAPVITSLAPMRTGQGATFSYTPTVASAGLEFQLVPAPPAGAWSFSNTSGTFTWPSIPAPGSSTPLDASDDTGYYRFGILVIDRAANKASYQPITLKITLGGAG